MTISCSEFSSDMLSVPMILLVSFDGLSDFSKHWTDLLATKSVLSRLRLLHHSQYWFVSTPHSILLNFQVDLHLYHPFQS